MSTYQQTKTSLLKRLVVYYIDFVIIFLTYFLLFFFACKPIITNTSKTYVDKINECYIEACNNLNQGEYQGYLMVDTTNNYGIQDLSKDEYSKTQKELNINITEEELEEKYTEAISKVEEKVSTMPVFLTNYNNFQRNYYLIVLLDLILVCFIYVLLIPLLNKDNKTIAMFIFKLAYVNIKDENHIMKYKILLRFLLEVLIDFVSIMILGEFFVLLPLLLSTILILATKNRLSIIDGITQSKIIDSNLINNKEIVNY